MRKKSDRKQKLIYQKNHRSQYFHKKTDDTGIGDRNLIRIKCRKSFWRNLTKDEDQKRKDTGCNTCADAAPKLDCKRGCQ